MSFDFQIGFPCPHLIKEERVRLAPDRMGMAISAPIAARGTIQVLVDDQYIVPANGLHTRAYLQSSLSGGYRIPKNETSITVSSNTETHTITLPVSKSLSTDKLVVLLNSHFEYLSAINYNGYLLLSETRSMGGESRIVVSGSARKALGFDFVSRAKGFQLYPAWRLERVPNKINERYPKFLEPLKNNPIIKVTYSTPAERCLRCSATYVENDFRVNDDGELQTITNENLLYQLCMKALLTEKGSNPFYTYYGTKLLSSIGKKALFGVQNFLRAEINTALKLLQKQQTAQSKYQEVSPSERLLQVLNVTVIPHENDPTAFLIDLTVMNASQKPVTLSIVYSAPSAVALAGSNGLSLGVK